MIEFREKLQKDLQDKLITWTGENSGLTDYVKTFDDHLHGFDTEETPDPFPFIVVNVRSAESKQEGEIGVTYDLWSWLVHIYYIDSRDDYREGDNARNTIMGTIVKKLEEDRRLGGFFTKDTDGHKEYVFDSKIDAVLFDVSGSEEYFTFVSELYLNVFTAKN